MTPALFSAPRDAEEWRKGVSGFLANSDKLYEQSDIESQQWDGLLRTLAAIFNNQPFLIADIWDRMNEKSNECPRQPFLTERTDQLRRVLPDFIAQAMDKEGFFKQRLGFAFRERLGRRYGDPPVRIERDIEDRHEKVARWKVVSDG